MKKLILLLVCAFIGVIGVSAQDGRSYVDNFIAKTGVELLENSGGSALLDIEIQVMGISMPMKIVSNGESYRADMSVQGQNILIVGNDDVAFVTVAGQTQKIEDKEQLAQLLPMRELTSETFFDFEDDAVFTYVGQEGKGNKLCDVVECKDQNADSKLFFNASTGMLDRIESEVVVEGEGDGVQRVVVVFSDYHSLSDGKLTLPGKISTKAGGEQMVIVIKDYQMDYPTAPWMFSFPAE